MVVATRHLYRCPVDLDSIRIYLIFLLLVQVSIRIHHEKFDIP